jgi:hypothetical protein
MVGCVSQISRSLNRLWNFLKKQLKWKIKVRVYCIDDPKMIQNTMVNITFYISKSLWYSQTNYREPFKVWRGFWQWWWPSMTLLGLFSRSQKVLGHFNKHIDYKRLCYETLTFFLLISNKFHHQRVLLIRKWLIMQKKWDMIMKKEKGEYLWCLLALGLASDEVE